MVRLDCKSQASGILLYYTFNVISCSVCQDNFTKIHRLKSPSVGTGRRCGGMGFTKIHPPQTPDGRRSYMEKQLHTPASNSLMTVRCVVWCLAQLPRRLIRPTTTIKDQDYSKPTATSTIEVAIPGGAYFLKAGHIAFIALTPLTFAGNP